ncbi:multidrug efflux SMR transporter [Vagococcus coleopterorum]|uniref:Multidrug efflux SMR transporter n=1 Tax=Vagococcus coleopterorum TaxID=2714946 RepID=A0A6G8AMR1_9ENTE|nr:multidrug efflux SMR transporter [Vagococcus coleopterorum]QIL46215.1 multidrug efflux SMR transporter [Vagococcus coleopterorum]
MAWLHLLIAGILEVVWATTMKLSDGFTKLNFSLLTIIGMIASFFFLSKAIKLLPMSLAYPIWTGIGAVGSIIIGVVIFKDALSLKTWFFVCLLLIGIIGIKLSSNA